MTVDRNIGFQMMRDVLSGKSSTASGIYSTCSASPFVLRAAMRQALAEEGHCLIEATCNQSNHKGGYTGLTPADFRDQVFALAREVGFPVDRLVLGGDHLGPLPFSKLPANQAMEEAAKMVDAYVRAGYTKIHLDPTMPLGGETVSDLSHWTKVVAERTAFLAKVAEDARRSVGTQLVYVVGSEVPAAGGVVSANEHVTVTTPDDLRYSADLIRDELISQGLAEVWERVIGFVVQPGVEYGSGDVLHYDPENARALAEVLSETSFVGEAHSTDYQRSSGLENLVRDNFRILKVGPWLTFAAREAIFNLERLEQELFGDKSSLRSVLRQVMLDDPQHWQKYYNDQTVELEYSLLDRSRYYMANSQVKAAITQLLSNLSGVNVPFGLLSQFLPAVFNFDTMDTGCLTVQSFDPEGAIIQAVANVYNLYTKATRKA